MYPTLPTELMQLIFSSFCPEDLRHARQVCRNWRALASSMIYGEGKWRIDIEHRRVPFPVEGVTRLYSIPSGERSRYGERTEFFQRLAPSKVRPFFANGPVWRINLLLIRRLELHLPTSLGLGSRTKLRFWRDELAHFTGVKHLHIVIHITSSGYAERSSIVGLRRDIEAAVASIKGCIPEAACTTFCFKTLDFERSEDTQRRWVSGIPKLEVLGYLEQKVPYFKALPLLQARRITRARGRYERHNLSLRDFPKGLGISYMTRCSNSRNGSNMHSGNSAAGQKLPL